MLLRRLVAALGPLLLCVLVCAAFRWMDGMIGAASFLAFLLKGALLGAALALTLPLADPARTNGLTGWLLLGAGIPAVALAYQYLETEERSACGAARRAVHQRTGGASPGRAALLATYVRRRCCTGQTSCLRPAGSALADEALDGFAAGQALAGRFGQASS